jgi:hypothetical protein
MPLDALATGPSRFSAEAGAAHETNVKAKHVTNPDMTIPDDFDPCRTMFPHLCLDASAEWRPQDAREYCQTIDTTMPCALVL